MADKKVYGKVKKYEWGLFSFFLILLLLFHVGSVLAQEIGFRIVIAIMNFLVSMLLLAGITELTSEEKEIEIGYVKESKK